MNDENIPHHSERVWHPTATFSLIIANNINIIFPEQVRLILSVIMSEKVAVGYNILSHQSPKSEIG